MEPAHAIEFFVEVADQHLRAAAYKLDGYDYYAWWWLEGHAGAMVHFDLCGGTAASFTQTRDVHRSLHASGGRHLRIIGKPSDPQEPARVSVQKKRQRKPAEITAWLALDIRPIPLNTTFPELRDRLRESTKRPPIQRHLVTLRREDFDSNGVNLVSYLCRPEHRSKLRERRPGLRSWATNGPDLNLLVFAEPFPPRGRQ